MATKDNDLIELMKDTITYQANVIKKRENLVHAITHNVKYLAEIHTKNNNELNNTKDHLAYVQKVNH